MAPAGDIGLAVGELASLTATYYDASGAPVAAATVEWRSSDPTVAEVSAAGVVRAVSVGVVSITASALGARDSATVHVRPTGLVFTQVNVGSVPCGLVVDGSAYCWETSPIAVPGGRSFTDLNAGYLRHSCALESGRAYCWGENDYGELGSAPTTVSRLPLAVSGGLTFLSVGAGLQFSCGLTTDGAAFCWGRNDSGRLGTGTYTGQLRCAGGTACSPTPVRVTGGHVFRSLSVGGAHVCGLVAAGAAYCWGANTLGTLGDGTTADSPRPVAVTGGRTFVAISAGAWHTCALTADGTAYCWGDNGRGLLGTRAPTTERCAVTEPCSPRPVVAAEGIPFTSLSAGGQSTCGISTGGLVFCWGWYYEALAPGGLVTHPLPVAGGLRFRSISAGTERACGLSTDAVVYCWRTGDDVDAWVRADSIVATRVPGQR